MNAGMDEFEIIARYFAPLAGEGAFGLGDDAAVLPLLAGHDLAVTTDAIAAGTDFFADDPPGTVAQKALRVNLSDLAAKGAAPAAYLLNLTLPRDVGEDWLADFAQGLKQDQAEFAVSLLGGDTSASDGGLSIAVTAFGFVPQGRMLRRSGARIGDHVYVTGTIGNSGGGLAVLRGAGHALAAAARDSLVARYRVPQPPVGFGAAHLLQIAHAGVDVSDGLIADLGHIASQSGVAIVVDGARVPLSDPVRALWGADALVRAVMAGDDYQIAFSGPAGLNGPFTAIGHVEGGTGVRLMLDGREVPIERPGFRHF
ncbi:MAG: thiamine-phosphate kinase [Alphaproteobacteria bacterium]|nr:thiamine-phosphate kinase [Alphaproteobacteria bacterium]